MIFVWTFHWKCVYLHCFLRGSRKDYSAAPFRHVRCTSTTQALHPNDEYSAPLLDDSVPCVSKPPRPPPVLPEGRRTWSVKREAWSDAIQMDSLLTPHYSLLILSKAIGLCTCSVRRLMPKSESEPSNKNKNFISPARTMCPLLVRSHLAEIARWKFFWSHGVMESSNFFINFFSHFGNIVYSLTFTNERS